MGWGLLGGPCSSGLGHSGIDLSPWWFSTCGPHTSSFSITWELVRTASLITFLPLGLMNQKLFILPAVFEQAFQGILLKAKFENCESKSLNLALGIPQNNPLCRNSHVGRGTGKPQTCLCDGTVHT